MNAITDDTDDLPGLSDGRLSLREAISASNKNAVSGDAAAGSPDGDMNVFANALSSRTIRVFHGQYTIGDDDQVNGSALNAPLTLQVVD